MYFLLMRSTTRRVAPPRSGGNYEVRLFMRQRFFSRAYVSVRSTEFEPAILLRSWS